MGNFNNPASRLMKNLKNKRFGHQGDCFKHGLVNIWQ